MRKDAPVVHATVVIKSRKVGRIMYDYSGLPEGLQGGMQLYVEKGISTGGFLTACL